MSNAAKVVTVLIVDDDADSRALTARVLSDVGATVREANSADSGLASVASCKPSILISDIGMSNLDGYQLLRALRDAAARGVRIRLLVDDLYTTDMDHLLLGLAARGTPSASTVPDSGR